MRPAKHPPTPAVTSPPRILTPGQFGAGGRGASSLRLPGGVIKPGDELDLRGQFCVSSWVKYEGEIASSFRVWEKRRRAWEESERSRPQDCQLLLLCLTGDEEEEEEERERGGSGGGAGRGGGRHPPDGEREREVTKKWTW